MCVIAKGLGYLHRLAKQNMDTSQALLSLGAPTVRVSNLD